MEFQSTVYCDTLQVTDVQSHYQAITMDNMRQFLHLPFDTFTPTFMFIKNDNTTYFILRNAGGAMHKSKLHVASGTAEIQIVTVLYQVILR